MNDVQTTNNDNVTLGWLMKHTTALRGISIALMIFSVIAIGRSIHIDQVITKLQSLAENMGLLGTLIFGGAYVLTALMFIPGSALTLASGAVFGVWIGSALVSIASTLTAALAFLIARYAARNRIEAAAQSRPLFAAIDRAIAEGGWKVVLLLRLSPIVPFSFGNYLFGLTGLRFWPYVFASWIGMMPGTIAYVYLGNLSVRGLAASAGDNSMTPLEWVLLIVGLIATITVAAILTRLARRELKKYVDTAEIQTKITTTSSSRKSPTIWIIASILFILAAVSAIAFEQQIAKMFGEASPSAESQIECKDPGNV